MKIGDKVRYDGVAWRICSRSNVSFSPVARDGEGIYIGWVDRYEGYTEREYVGNYGEDAYINIFMQEKSVRLMRIQPIDKSGRWRKPIECFPEQVEGIEE